MTGKTCLMKTSPDTLRGMKNNFQLPNWKFIADFFPVHSVAQPLRRFFACKVVEINANCVDSRLFSVWNGELEAIPGECEFIFHTKFTFSFKKIFF